MVLDITCALRTAFDDGDFFHSCFFFSYCSDGFQFLRFQIDPTEKSIAQELRFLNFIFGNYMRLTDHGVWPG